MIVTSVIVESHCISGDDKFSDLGNLSTILCNFNQFSVWGRRFHFLRTVFSKPSNENKREVAECSSS